MKNNTYIIAEIGINHNGSKKNIFKLIKKAKEAGANAVKFQLYLPETLANPRDKLKKNYFSNKKKETLFEMWKRLRIRDSWIKEISQFTKKIKIDLGFSVFDNESLKKLKNINYNFLKIASSDITDLNLIKKIYIKNKKTFISTGMADIKEIKSALKIFKNKKKLTILYCVSLYPTRLKHLNFYNFTILKKLNKRVGFSDHTVGTTASLYAINLGASAIEKHFTLDKKDIGPDHACSANFQELKNICDYAKETREIVSKRKTKLLNDEIKMKAFARKSLYAKKNLKANDIITENNIVVRRPCVGIEAKYFNNVLNKKIKKNIKAHQPINFKDI